MAEFTSRSKRLVVLAITAVLTVAGAGIAFAYWTSTGTGVGSASTGDSVAFTIESDSPVGTIEPGSAGQTVAFTVTNASSGGQYLSGVTVAMAGPTGVAWVPAAGCDIDDYTATITTAPATGTIAAGASRNGTVTVTLANTGVNQDACQGESVPLYFVAS
ncbi:MAG TPA: hypothetical protein VLI04_15380 [Nocardioidaceae bacterium]|nr:hypothetical protein [Nocardioidaceae bacterium]